MTAAETPKTRGLQAFAVMKCEALVAENFRFLGRSFFVRSKMDIAQWGQFDARIKLPQLGQTGVHVLAQFGRASIVQQFAVQPGLHLRLGRSCELVLESQLYVSAHLSDAVGLH